MYVSLLACVLGQVEALWMVYSHVYFLVNVCIGPSQGTLHGHQLCVCFLVSVFFGPGWGTLDGRSYTLGHLRWSSAMCISLSAYVLGLYGCLCLFVGQFGCLLPVSMFSATVWLFGWCLKWLTQSAKSWIWIPLVVGFSLDTVYILSDLISDFHPEVFRAIC